MTTEIDYALLAGASYYDTRTDINRFPVPQEWSVISRSPQNASSGFEASTYKKDNEVETTSHICRLTDEERINEIAHMLSGNTLTDAAIENAKELLKQSSKKNEHGRKK